MMNQKGQSLVEALIALGVATIVVSAMAVAAITAVNNADFSKYQNLATQYAQQGVEIVRQQSQTDWNIFYTNYVGSWPSGRSWCLSQNLTWSPMPVTGCTKNINNQNGIPFDAYTTWLYFIYYSRHCAPRLQWNGTGDCSCFVDRREMQQRPQLLSQHNA
jgi:hypothetical protein